jgi:hypothetical protein
MTLVNVFLLYLALKVIGCSGFIVYRQEQCPHSIPLDPTVEQEEGIFVRQEFSNLSEEFVEVFRLKNGVEYFVAEIPPLVHSFLRVDTFIGAQFIVKSIQSKVVLLALTVGLHPIRGTECIGMPSGSLGPGQMRSPGTPLPMSTIIGWMNDSPCDITASWVNNGTEYWIANMNGNVQDSHFEITYTHHNFVFRYPDGRIIQHFKIGPAEIPRCPFSRNIMDVQSNERNSFNVSIKDNNPILPSLSMFTSSLNSENL